MILLAQLLTVLIPTLSWEQPSTTAAQAQAYVYTLYVNTTTTAVLAHTCVEVQGIDGLPMATCWGDFPIASPGTYLAELTAKDQSGNESGHSNQISVTVEPVPPVTPTIPTAPERVVITKTGPQP